MKKNLLLWLGLTPYLIPSASTITEDLFHIICFKSGSNFESLAQDAPIYCYKGFQNWHSLFTTFSQFFIFFFTSAKLRPRNSMRTLPTSSTSSISNFFEAAKSSTSSSESEHEKPSRSSIRPGMLMFGLEKNVGDPTRNFF